MLLLMMFWKAWTGLLLAGALAGWWSFAWGVGLFFLPDALVFAYLVVAAYEGRRERKARDRALARLRADRVD